MELLFDGEKQAMRTWMNKNEVKKLAVPKSSDWNSAFGPENGCQLSSTALNLTWQAYDAGGANTV
jgi:hypothetical protein